jgi:hypothetical protein
MLTKMGRGLGAPPHFVLGLFSNTSPRKKTPEVKRLIPYSVVDPRQAISRQSKLLRDAFIENRTN